MLRFLPWLSLVALLLVAPDARAGSWLRPVDGALLRAFAVGRDPYARGWHRGVDLAGARGSPVRSACTGLVSFAGRVPRGGRTVSVRCGAIVATYQQLGSIAVGSGRRVARGALLGVVGASSDPRERRSHVHLGARVVTTGRYLDPLDLLGGSDPWSPLRPHAGPARPRAAPLGPAPVSPRSAPLRPVVASPRLAPARPAPASPRVAPVRPTPEGPRTAPGRLAAGGPRTAPARPAAGLPIALGGVDSVARGGPGGRGFEPGVPWTVWVGLACAGLGLPFGGLVHMRRRRHATRRVTRTV